MDKQTAINLLGGSISSAAKRIGVSYPAVRKWPDPLSPRIADRVEAALAREAREAAKPPTNDTAAGATAAH